MPILDDTAVDIEEFDSAYASGRDDVPILIYAQVYITNERDEFRFLKNYLPTDYLPIPGFETDETIAGMAYQTGLITGEGYEQVFPVYAVMTAKQYNRFLSQKDVIFSPIRYVTLRELSGYTDGEFSLSFLDGIDAVLSNLNMPVTNDNEFKTEWVKIGETLGWTNRPAMDEDERAGESGEKGTWGWLTSKKRWLDFRGNFSALISSSSSIPLDSMPVDIDGGWMNRVTLYTDGSGNFKTDGLGLMNKKTYTITIALYNGSYICLFRAVPAHSSSYGHLRTSV
jgi:hypothetical protein